MVLAMAAYGQKTEICPQIDCDCGTLPSEQWQTACSSHERQIKQRCAGNNNVPLDFCSVHGPAATPLPLALKFTEVSVLPEAELDREHKSAANFYSSVYQDLTTMKTKVSALRFKEALSLAKNIDHNIESLFALQRRVTMSWLVYEKSSDAVSAWRNYADDSEEMAQELYDYGQELWGKYSEANNDAAKKAYKVLTFKILRNAGKGYEMAAYGYSGGERSKKAAEVWMEAANVSKTVLAAKKESNADSSHINFYQYQVASRLHRASYHYAIDSENSEALKVLTLAQEVVPQNNLAALIKVEEEKEASALTNL